MLVEGRHREGCELKKAFWANGLSAGDGPRDDWRDMLGFCWNLQKVLYGGAKQCFIKKGWGIGCVYRKRWEGSLHGKGFQRHVARPEVRWGGGNQLSKAISYTGHLFTIAQTFYILATLWWQECHLTFHIMWMLKETVRWILLVKMVSSSNDNIAIF